MSEYPDLLHRLFAHMAWADERTCSALRAMTEPPAQALDLYAHVLTAEHIWLRRVEGISPAYDVWQSVPLDECARLARANREGFARVLVEPERLRPISYRTTNGTPHITPLEDILLHVSHHGMYHRGQIALLTRMSGGVPLPIDYILFQRELQ
jgi:uncharacterized damage-inducible protein DinB